MAETLQDVKKAKSELEIELLKKLQAFEKSYGVYVDYISIRRKPVQRKRVKNVPYPVEVGEFGKQPLQDVNFELRFLD